MHSNRRSGTSTPTPIDPDAAALAVSRSRRTKELRLHLPSNSTPSGGILDRVTRSRDRSIQWSVAAVTLVAVMAPLLPLFYQAFLDNPLYDAAANYTATNFGALLGHPDMSAALTNTFVFGILSTVVAMIVGLTTAILMVRTDLPGRALLGELLLWPFYISGIILSFGWITVYGPSGIATLWTQRLLGFAPWDLYTMTGLSLVNGVSLAPLVFLYCLASAKMQDTSLEDAAKVCGAGPLRAMLQVSLPMMRPAILFSGFYVFIISIESLAIPLVLGSPVGLKFFTTILYTEGFEQTNPDYGLVASGAVILLVTVTLLLAIQNRFLRGSGKFVTVTGKATQPRLLRLGAARWPLFVVVLLYVVLTIGPVAYGVTLRAFTVVLSPYAPLLDVLTLDNFRQVFSQEVYIRSITNSFLIALIGGAVGTIFVSLIVIVAKRSSFPATGLLEQIAMLPRSVPGLLVGIGAFYAASYLPFLAPLRGSIAILIILFVMRYIPTAYGSIAPALMQIGPEMDRASRSSGADWWQTTVSITLPLLRPAMVTCFCILFIRLLSEYAAAVFLYSPGTEVIGTTMLIFWAQGSVGPVAALAVVQLAIIAIFVVAARRIFKVRIYG
ncbi:iron ABC transporter permease [Cereibacter sp. SYSU M97828]|nr:iron ABC transporter permease [Cereibacter flavus]